MLRNKRSKKGNCVGEMSEWSGLGGWPNGEGVAIIWHQGDMPDQVRAPKGLAADCMPTAQSDVQKSPGLIPKIATEKDVFRTFLPGDNSDRSIHFDLSVGRGSRDNFLETDF
jgi:hypothetical protein